MVSVLLHAGGFFGLDLFSVPVCYDLFFAC